VSSGFWWFASNLSTTSSIATGPLFLYFNLRLHNLFYTLHMPTTNRKEFSPRYVFDTSSGLYIPEIHPDASNPKSYGAGSKRNFPLQVNIKRDWIIVTISALTIVLLSFTVYYAHKQWIEMVTAANAASSSAEAAKKSAESAISEMRPWLSVRIELTKALSFQNGARTEIYATVLNNGHSPALYVRFRPVLFFLAMKTWMNEEVRNKQSQVCGSLEKIDNNGYGSGNTIFPGDHFETRQVIGVSANEVTIALGSTKIPGMLGPIVVGCLDYQWNTTAREHHQTAVAYQLGVPSRAYMGMWRGFFHPRGTVNPIQLVQESQWNWAN
jgi:hypothetical protein